MDYIIMNDKNLLFDIAQEAFYQWENKLFPDGKTPYSDNDRILWCEGFVAAKLQNTQILLEAEWTKL